ncbi:MAG: hypothetical protein IT210_16985 [Armatimonadetes bacterium]|nr:hypothetical protein [Armatimonadota bacterium]
MDLLLCDRQGRERALFEIDASNSPGLPLWDTGTEDQVLLEVEPEGRSGLALSNQKGNPIWKSK